MALSAEEFLKLAPPQEAVELEGHGKVFVKGLTAEERDDYEQSLLEAGPDGTRRVRAHQKNMRAALVIRCLVSEQGERLFSDRQLAEVGKVDSAVVNKVWQEARRLSGMEVPEEAVEAFDSAQGDGSSSE